MTYFSSHWLNYIASLGCMSYFQNSTFFSSFFHVERRTFSFLCVLVLLSGLLLSFATKVSWSDCHSYFFGIHWGSLRIKNMQVLLLACKEFMNLSATLIPPQLFQAQQLRLSLAVVSSWPPACIACRCWSHVSQLISYLPRPLLRYPRTLDFPYATVIEWESKIQAISLPNVFMLLTLLWQNFCGWLITSSRTKNKVSSNFSYLHKPNQALVMLYITLISLFSL